MHEIATRLACDNSNVTGIVDRLEARGLVTRRPGEQDRRVKYDRAHAARAWRCARRCALEWRACRRRSSASPAEDQRLLRDLLARATADA